MRRNILMLGVVMALCVPSVAMAQEEPDEPPPSGSADISLVGSGPSSVASGEAATFTFSVTNEGPETAPQANVSISVPEGFEDPVLTPDDPSVSCSWNGYAYGTPEADGAAPGWSGGYAMCDLGDMIQGRIVGFTLEATRVRAQELYVSGWAGSAAEDVNYEDNYVDLFVEADRSAPADLGVTMTGPKTIAMGDNFTLDVTVANDGPSDAERVVVTVMTPDGSEVQTVPEGCTYSEGSNDGGGGVEPAQDEPITDGPSSDMPEFWAPPTIRCDVGSLTSGASETLSIVARRTSGWELWSSAWVSGANLDEFYDNDYASWSTPADPSVSSDLSVDVTPPSETPLVGDTFDATFSVGNSGPAVAGDVTLYDYLPYGLQFVSSTDERCTFEDYSYKEPTPYEGDLAASRPAGAAEDAYPIYYGGGFLNCAFGVVEIGQTIDVTVTLERTSAYELYDYASVYSSNWDPHYENNYSEAIYEPDRTHQADISVSLTAPEDVVVGENFEFTLDVTNLGPNPATGVGLYDYLPAGIEPTSETLPEGCTYNGYGGEGAVPQEDVRPSYENARELVCEFGDLASEESRSVTIQATRTSDWEIWNSAWATSTSFDPEYENDYAYFVLPGENPWDDCTFEEGKGDDSIVVDECAVASGDGADSVNVETSTGGKRRDVRTGSGPDSISVDVGTGSISDRRIDVRSGRGADGIDVTVAPGAGDVRINIWAGAGADRIRLDVAPQARDVVITIHGGDGPDSIRTVRYPRAGGVMTVIYGGDGKDVLLGGNGPDSLFGQSGRDLLDAGAGDDVLDGGKDKATCLDGPGMDSLRACRRR